MPHQKNILKKVILFLILGVGLTGCTYTPDLNIDQFTPNNSESSYESRDSQSYDPSQEVSYSGTASLETKNYDADKQKLINTIKEYDGIIQSEDSKKRTQDMIGETYIYSNFQVKVPSKQLTALSEKIQEAFTVSSYNLNSQDVGEEKQSTQSQIDAINKEIEEIQTDIEQENLTSDQKQTLKQKIRDLESERRDLQASKESTQDSINYANLNINLLEVAYYYNEKPSALYYFRIAFTDFLGKAIIVLSYALMAIVFVLPFILIASLTFLTVRKQWYKWLNKMYQTGKFNVPIIKPQFPQYTDQEIPQSTSSTTDKDVFTNKTEEK